MKTDYAKDSEEYARAEIARLEGMLASEDSEGAEGIRRVLEGQYSNLAQALYSQTRLKEARAAAVKGFEGWREGFIALIDSVANALERRDGELCLCLEGLPFNQRYSIQPYGVFTLLHCPKCLERFALTQLPEQLARIRSVRIDLAANKELQSSIPDELL